MFKLLVMLKIVTFISHFGTIANSIFISVSYFSLVADRNTIDFLKYIALLVSCKCAEGSSHFFVDLIGLPTLGSHIICEKRVLLLTFQSG